MLKFGTATNSTVWSSGPGMILEPKLGGGVAAKVDVGVLQKDEPFSFIEKVII